MEASAIEPSPPAHLFTNFAKTPVREYARRDAEGTDTEMQDDSPFIRVQSTSQLSLSDRDSPILHGCLALSGVRESKAMDDSKSWSSFYQASRPTSVAHDNGGEFSLVLGEASDVNTGGFTFDPSLDFFGQEQQTLPTDEKQSRAFSWTPADLSSSSHEYNTPSSSPIHLFHTLQVHQHPSARDIETRRKGITLQRLFLKPYTPYFSMAK